ncbi:MAG: dephospho-CoA kinase [Planctomycetota bacterium]|jgi:dephospho-CoA kinase
MSSPPVIGLTGGIGAGKSTVARMLAALGCVVCDSDALGRAALRDPEVRSRLVEWWGEAILDDAGEVDRASVAVIVFDDPAQRRRLEALTHPWIESRRAEQFAAAGADTVALVIDAPLLLEAGLGAGCDAVIFVDADPDVRLGRVAAGRGWDAAELRRREESQLPLDEKRSKADYVVTNDGDQGDLESQVRETLRTIVESLNGNTGQVSR